MLAQSFQALVVETQPTGQTVALRHLTPADLPEGDVLVQVAYSTINYKDGLAVTGKGKILRDSPIVPGIDLAGTVIESSHPDYRPGDVVIGTGWGLGERHWGGYSQYTRLNGAWLVPLPEGMSLRQAMQIGTAGLTAMLCVLALERQGLQPNGREVVVTGAAGGVGSLAVALLAKAGYHVVAATGRPHEAEYLHHLGAQAIIERAELAQPGRPLERERWAAAIDTVGGATLAGLIRSMVYYGSIAACGNAGGVELQTSVFPFILRGVRLIGVESVQVPKEVRLVAWERLARDLPADLLDSTSETIGLAEIPQACERITSGQVRGRLLVELDHRAD